MGGPDGVHGDKAIVDLLRLQLLEIVCLGTPSSKAQAFVLLHPTMSREQGLG
jgi:hypothetical protein